MTSNARVWNDNDKPYSEKFRDDLITIPPKQFIEMDRADAIQFIGQWVPIRQLDDGTPLNAKRLRLEDLTLKNVQPVKIQCQMCKEQFQTDKELALHSELKHAEAMIDDDARKDAAKRAR